jgi:gephyrin
LGITRDVEAEVSQLLDKALASNADILITSGGVSAGDKDFVKPLLERRGKVYLSKVNILRLSTQHNSILLIDFNHPFPNSKNILLGVFLCEKSLFLISLSVISQVLMKPGKPFTFATLEARTRSAAETRQLLVFGLPGNPVSSAVTFNLFAVPAIRHLSGWVDSNLRK